MRLALLRAFFLAGAVAFGVVLASPPGHAQSIVQNQALIIAATSIPTNGVTTNLLGGNNCNGGLACPGGLSVAGYSGKFSNSSASTVYCGIYASAPTLGSTALVGTVTIVPATTSVPFYWGPTNGIAKAVFPNGMFAGCATGYLGSTGVAQNVVGVEVYFL